MKEKTLQHPLFQVGVSVIALCLGEEVVSLILSPLYPFLIDTFSTQSTTLPAFAIIAIIVRCLTYSVILYFLPRKWAINLRDYAPFQSKFKVSELGLFLIFIFAVATFNSTIIYSLQHYLQELPLSSIYIHKFSTLIYSKEWIPSILLISVLTPICEELFFRGLIQNYLLQSYTPTKALLISTSLFTLAHFTKLGNNFLALFILGLILGLILLKTDSLFLCIIFHSLYNHLVISTKQELIPISQLSPSYIITLSLNGLIVVIGLSLLLRRKTILKS